MSLRNEFLCHSDSVRVNLPGDGGFLLRRLRHRALTSPAELYRQSSLASLRNKYLSGPLLVSKMNIIKIFINFLKKQVEN